MILLVIAVCLAEIWPVLSKKKKLQEKLMCKHYVYHTKI